MGSDPELFFDNLFLFYHERHYINNLKKKKCFKSFKMSQSVSINPRVLLHLQIYRWSDFYQSGTEIFIPLSWNPRKKNKLIKTLTF